MARGIWVKKDGAWHPVTTPQFKEAGWNKITKGFYKAPAGWQQFWPIEMVPVTFKVTGGGGGGGGTDSPYGGYSGYSGAQVTGSLILNIKDRIQIFVGGGGLGGTSGTGNSGGAGGTSYNGFIGGAGGATGQSGWSGSGGGGGAASVILINFNPIIVAGGGGGGGGGGNYSAGKPQQAHTSSNTTNGGAGQDKMSTSTPGRFGGNYDGGGGGGGGGGYNGGGGGLCVSGDNGAYSGSSGDSLVPANFSLSQGDNAGPPGANGNSGRVEISYISVTGNPQFTGGTINNINGKITHIFDSPVGTDLAGIV